MEDYTTLILAWLIMLAGIGVILSGFIKFKKIPKMNPVIAVAGGAILILIGAVAGGYIPNPFAGDETTTEPAQVAPDTVDCPTFDITPASGTISILNSAKDAFSVPAYANTTGHTLIQTDNSTSWANPTCSFYVQPDPFLGADNTDLGTIYYEVYDEEISVDTSTDSYKLFTKTGGNRQVIWTGSGTEYVEGSHTMTMTENVTLTLTFTVTQDSMSRIEDTYDPLTVYVKFSNGCGDWSEIYAVDFFLAHSW
jgi:hypothetical protein